MLHPGNEWLFQAYLDLDTCREIGMVVGPIPFDTTMIYGRDELEMDRDGCRQLWRIIHKADMQVRAHRAAKDEKQQAAG